MAFWYCVDCNKTLQENHRLRHEASWTHRSKARYIPPMIEPPRRSRRLSETQECEICYESKRKCTFKKCTQCIHTWCAKCNTKIAQCPFCRRARETPRAPRAPPAPPVRLNNVSSGVPSNSSTTVTTPEAIMFTNFVREIGHFIRELIVGFH